MEVSTKLCYFVIWLCCYENYVVFVSSNEQDYFMDNSVLRQWWFGLSLSRLKQSSVEASILPLAFI
ncbi:hypothetical protein J6590_017621 [Homalodisca vitripennis]|nr:hypothetical protein J6590_017621 [Homalodisca vitripennis]